MTYYFKDGLITEGSYSEVYGDDVILERIQNLITNRYLKFASSEESLRALIIVQLKEILRDNKQKLSGNKNELINQVVRLILKIAENFKFRNISGRRFIRPARYEFS